MIAKQLKIICPFCNTPYNAYMLNQINEASGFCDTCAGPPTSEVSIYCSHCGNLVYRKFYTPYDEDKEMMEEVSELEVLNDKKNSIEKEQFISEKRNLIDQVRVQQSLLERYIEKYGQDEDIYGKQGKLDKPTVEQLANRKGKLNGKQKL